MNAGYVSERWAGVEVHAGSAFGPADETTALDHSDGRWWVLVLGRHPLSVTGPLQCFVASAAC